MGCGFLLFILCWIAVGISNEISYRRQRAALAAVADPEQPGPRAGSERLARRLRNVVEVVQDRPSDAGSGGSDEPKCAICLSNLYVESSSASPDLSAPPPPAIGSTTTAPAQPFGTDGAGGAAAAPPRPTWARLACRRVRSMAQACIQAARTRVCGLPPPPPPPPPVPLLPLPSPPLPPLPSAREPMRLLTCRHVFHWACLRGWCEGLLGRQQQEQNQQNQGQSSQDRRKRCPMCRTVYLEEVETPQEQPGGQAPVLPELPMLSALLLTLGTDANAGADTGEASAASASLPELVAPQPSPEEQQASGSGGDASQSGTEAQDTPEGTPVEVGIGGTAPSQNAVEAQSLSGAPTGGVTVGDPSSHNAAQSQGPWGASIGDGRGRAASLDNVTQAQQRGTDQTELKKQRARSS
ncbi:hypothetical protein GGTG_12293 [Gaeumannomyces tritici R3-111a-1]|uniref:RING-type domain-containing protein n=1 Tax=Gaeumannomyces tritici (strain R3-111a-1) TaxID=644352 RepID=J3PFL8_GAET3|nr:hypothetical protein GGTG_12293 [Gaeumannomyces tritici R3-111a-1]EJT70120.1 hypothetical protein GGTG_12293 [Gaeumannomyces tritici R3-111a-1]